MQIILAEYDGDAAYPREGTVTVDDVYQIAERSDAAYPREGTVTW